MTSVFQDRNYRRPPELMRDYELMRVRRVRPNPPAPTLNANVPDPQIHMHVENIFEVNDISTQHHVVRVNGTEVGFVCRGWRASDSKFRRLSRSDCNSFDSGG